MICGAFEASDMSAVGGQRISESDVDGIRILRVAEPYANRMGFVARIRAFGRFARTAAEVVSGLDADLVFATSTPLTVGIPGMKGARRLGVPFVFEVRDLWPEIPIAIGVVRNPLLKWHLARMERKIYRAANHIIALAPGIRDGICRTGYPPERVTMIPNCSDLDLFRPDDSPVEDDRFGPPNTFRLVFTGAHGLANGLDAVLDAAAELKRRGEQNLRFVFIGQGGQRDRLIERSRQEGLSDMTSWVDPLPKAELARVLPRMDVGMMILRNLPAFYFGTSPNKFFDYIASGLPVLNNYPGWLAGMIEEHKCGLVVPPDDPGAFADAVLWLRDHPEERRAMGQRGRQLAERDFSRDRLGEMFVRTLEQAHDEFKRKR
jgi:glycosyltransferase involved in cell wall biosynthesis